MSDLIRYASGNQPVPRKDKAVYEQAKAIYDKTRVAAFKADSAFVLAEHIMDKAAKLDATRRQIAKDDPILNMALAEIEIEALNAVKQLQRELNEGWRL